MYQTKPLLERDYYNIFSRGAQEPKTGAAVLRKRAESDTGLVFPGPPQKFAKQSFAGKRLRPQAHFEANRRASGGT